MADEKELLGDSMDMFSHGNDTLTRTQATAPEPARADAAPPVIPAADRPRDEQGRFASQDAAPQAPAPAAPIPPANADAETEKQPITKAEFKGMLEERDKRHKAEAKAAELERRIQQFESQQQPPQIPSASDPEAFAQYLQQQKTNTVFDVSETMAREKHGDELVSKAMDWALQRAQQSPAFAAEYLKQKHPIDWAVKQQKREATLNDIGDDPDAYVRRRAAELGLTGQANPQPQAAQPATAASPQPASQQQQTPAPTRSIANAMSAGGAGVVPPSGEFAAIDGMFNR